MAYTLATASPPVAVITFNARGFGGSSGGASWWGCEAEQRDYEGVVRWAVARAAWLSGEEEDQQGDVADQVEVPAKRVEMICCVSSTLRLREGEADSAVCAGLLARLASSAIHAVA